MCFVLALVLAAEFVNGWHDASNAIATVVSTRVLSPRVAILMATVFNAVGGLRNEGKAETFRRRFSEPSLAISALMSATSSLAPDQRQLILPGHDSYLCRSWPS